MPRVMLSILDNSANYIDQHDRGFLESRYVYREGAPYFITYLSSHGGCNQGCKFCHLTATKQTSFVPATVTDYVRQAEYVLDHYNNLESKPQVQYMHYNFMARGEPLANPHLVDDAKGLFEALQKQCSYSTRLPSKFNISTIMPRSMKKTLAEVFKDSLTPTIYYSLYSLRDDFRRKWLPNAMPVGQALTSLRDFQRSTGGQVVIHFALIRGENDSQRDLRDLALMLQDSGIHLRFNIVRYNPPDTTSTEVSAEVLEERVAYLEELFPGKVQEVPRVGLDVKASCGMFVVPN